MIQPSTLEIDQLLTFQAPDSKVNEVIQKGNTQRIEVKVPSFKKSRQLKKRSETYLEDRKTIENQIDR